MSKFGFYPGSSEYFYERPRIYCTCCSVKLSELPTWEFQERLDRGLIFLDSSGTSQPVYRGGFCSEACELKFTDVDRRKKTFREDLQFFTKCRDAGLLDLNKTVFFEKGAHVTYANGVEFTLSDSPFKDMMRIALKLKYGYRTDIEYHVRLNWTMSLEDFLSKYNLWSEFDDDLSEQDSTE